MGGADLDRVDAVRLPRRADAQRDRLARRVAAARAWRSCGPRAPGIVEAADAERRRLERDLHDGAQSRLVALALLLQGGPQEGRRRRSPTCSTRRRTSCATSLAELRELARGIHPAVLTDRGLEPALRTLADRAPVPVDDPRRDPASGSPASVESAAYFVASEALTNVAKYSQATEASVIVRADQRPRDGRGRRRRDRRRGRRPRLSGLRGLSDRVAALDGKLSVESPQGHGTRLRAEIPVRRLHGPVALLELLARPAPARVVAAELLVLVDARCCTGAADDGSASSPS